MCAGLQFSQLVEYTTTIRQSTMTTLRQKQSMQLQPKALHQERFLICGTNTSMALEGGRRRGCLLQRNAGGQNLSIRARRWCGMSFAVLFVLE